MSNRESNICTQPKQNSVYTKYLRNSVHNKQSKTLIPLQTPPLDPTLGVRSPRHPRSLYPSSRHTRATDHCTPLQEYPPCLPAVCLFLCGKPE
ncbi:hypothetical protein HanIR_Chr04g0166181 [Helianthus annuus]|nr:hypothetical protein HanIR_Chr04g0166181 [Helianthus annuus]